MVTARLLSTGDHSEIDLIDVKLGGITAWYNKNGKSDRYVFKEKELKRLQIVSTNSTERIWVEPKEGIYVDSFYIGTFGPVGPFEIESGYAGWHSVEGYLSVTPRLPDYDAISFIGPLRAFKTVTLGSTNIVKPKNPFSLGLYSRGNVKVNCSVKDRSGNVRSLEDVRIWRLVSKGTGFVSERSPFGTPSAIKPVFEESSRFSLLLREMGLVAILPEAILQIDLVNEYATLKGGFRLPFSLFQEEDMDRHEKLFNFNLPNEMLQPSVIDRYWNYQFQALTGISDDYPVGIHVNDIAQILDVKVTKLSSIKKKPFASENKLSKFEVIDGKGSIHFMEQARIDHSTGPTSVSRLVQGFEVKWELPADRTYITTKAGHSSKIAIKQGRWWKAIPYSTISLIDVSQNITLTNGSSVEYDQDDIISVSGSGSVNKVIVGNPKKIVIRR
ncbi:hypothetical protein OAM01_01320 [bacterium]|nr:hypothetical protein [bacterium]